MSRAGVYRPHAERFWEKVSQQGDCWVWTAYVSKRGYGCYAVTTSHNYSAHRFAYEDMVGEIPEGLVLDHLCRVRHCVNPDHLEPVTGTVNTQRSVRAIRTECVHGHPLDVQNTYCSPDGRRRCRTCRRIYKRRRRHDLKVAAA